MAQEFWMPEPIRPIEPERNWIARNLLQAGRISMAGWAIYGIFAFAFDDIRVIPDLAQSILAIIGGGLIVIGAEMNSIPLGVAVFHKVGQKKHTWLDIAAFAVSGIGSLMSILIMFSLRQAVGNLEYGWRVLLLNGGPLVAGLATACDYLAAIVELGLLKSDYESELNVWISKMEIWRKQQLEWNEQHGVVEPIDRSTWPVGTLDDLRRIAAGMNGERTGITADNLQDVLDREQLRMPERSTSTLEKWATAARNGGK